MDQPGTGQNVAKFVAINKENHVMRLSIFALLSLVLLTPVFAQEKTVKKSDPLQPLIFKLNDAGDRYVRVMTWHQLWLTSGDLGVNQPLRITPMLRRARLLGYAQLSQRLLMLGHMGLNNLNAQNLTATGIEGDGPQIFLHDAWVEYKIKPWLYLGGGLHYWNGLTRMASASTFTFLTLDNPAPNVGWPQLGYTQQFGRNLGLYAKGEYGRFDYRLSLNQPLAKNFEAGKNLNALNAHQTIYHSWGFLPGTQGQVMVEGYARWHFWDKESILLPFTRGTYLGQKTLLTMGAGFFYHPHGSIRLPETSEPVDVNLSGDALQQDIFAKSSLYDVWHAAADIMLEKPLSNSTVLTVYLAGMNFQYGPSWLGKGTGTGQAAYGHAALLHQPSKLQPYLALQWREWDIHQKTSRPAGYTLDLGINYYLQEHQTKFTLEYHQVNYSGDINIRDTDLQQLRFQVQLAL